VPSINKIENSNPFPVALFFTIFLVFFGKYNIDIGFALKPHMLFLITFFIIHLSVIFFYKLQLFECAMLFFFLVYCFAGTFALYGIDSLRVVCGIALYLFCFFIMRAIITRSNQNLIEKYIAYTGIFFNLASLLLFFFGLKKLNFILQGDGIYSLGVFMDREYPRLIGLVTDPNYFVFYNTLFFTYFLCNLNKKRNVMGLIFCILASLLTFSRGGIAAYLLIFLLYVFIRKNFAKKVKLLIGAFISIIVTLYLAISLLHVDVYSVIQSRMQDFENDGGSGRFELWGRAWLYFVDSPLFGLGPFNFLPYNKYQYGDSLQVHNTFLEVLSETGAIGFFSFTLFLALTIFQLFQHQVHQKKPYLFLAFFGFLLQMLSLSVMVNELLFLYLAILSAYFQQEEENYVKKTNQLNRLFAGR
jgi:O-antigen ligase